MPNGEKNPDGVTLPASTPANPATGTANVITADDYDEGLDLNKLPPFPWTYAALGPDNYHKLAVVGGYHEEKGWFPDLDPNSFGKGRAVRRAALGLFPLPPDGLEESGLEAWFASLSPEQQHAYNETNHATGLLIQSLRYTGKGTKRPADAPALQPVKMTEKRNF